MSILVSLLIMCLVFGIVYYIITLIPLPSPFKTIAMIIMALIFLCIVLNMFGFMGTSWFGGPHAYVR